MATDLKDGNTPKSSQGWHGGNSGDEQDKTEGHENTSDKAAVKYPKRGKE